VRTAAGLARTGTVFDHGSGDFVIAFTTACRVGQEPRGLLADRAVLADERRAMEGLFPAVVESVEEAVLNSIWRAETVIGRDGHVRHALPLEEVAVLVDAHGLR
jgi:D-aminopeptidase